MHTRLLGSEGERTAAALSLESEPGAPSTARLKCAGPTAEALATLVVVRDFISHPARKCMSAWPV